MSDKKRPLLLPSINYGPICLKILKEFVEHHDLPKDLPVPEMYIPMHKSLSRIFDIIIHSMGDEKRQKILDDLDKYKMDMPSHFR